MIINELILFLLRIENENDVDMIRGQFKWNALHTSNKAIKFIVDQVYYLKTSHKIDQSNRNNKMGRIIIMIMSQQQCRKGNKFKAIEFKRASKRF